MRIIPPPGSWLRQWRLPGRGVVTHGREPVDVKKAGLEPHHVEALVASGWEVEPEPEAKRKPPKKKADEAKEDS